MYELKECPFCGAIDSVELIDNEYEKECASIPVQYSVICNAINGGCGSATGWQDSDDEAVELWNRAIREDRG